MHIRRGYREFDADSVLERGEKQLIQIVSARSKTAIFVNGIRTGDSLCANALPETGLRGRLVLGNSATAGEPWSGELYGIVLYQREMSAEEAAMRFGQWNSMGSKTLPIPVHATHFFPFNEAQGNIAHDCIASGFDLQIPKLFRIIKKQVLVGPWDDFQWSYSYFSDVLVNLFGFAPLGFFMSMFLFEVSAIPSRKKNILRTIFICFIISLCIELAQVYIPTRSSQLSDLICNTLGGAAGGFFAGLKRKQG